MSRALALLHGSGTGGAWTDGDEFPLADFVKLRDNVALFAAGALQTNVSLGGSETEGIPATATGDKKLLHWLPWLIQNPNSQVSGFSDAHSAAIVAQVRYFLRVSNGAISVTPKLFYGTAMTGVTTAATISGAAACAATSNAYSGTNQIQTITFTVPANTIYIAAGFTIAGTVDPTYQAWARAFGDLYVLLP